MSLHDSYPERGLSRRRILLLVPISITILIFVWYSHSGSPGALATRPQPAPATPYNDFDGRWNYERDGKTLQLTLDQCDQAFPSLFDEVDRAVEHWSAAPINEAKLDEITPRNGFVRAMIYDQNLYIISKTGGIYSRELATISAIHRSILSSPERLPNIEFAFNADDVVGDKVPLWSYARRAEDTHLWLIPDFGHWSWPETKVGSLSEVRMKAIANEKTPAYSWKNKINKLMWRGATMGLSLRERLLAVTKDQPEWSDVKALDWHNSESMHNDLKSMPEHCQYRFLMQTEGNSYSGRLKYLQNCQSVVVSHPLDWIEHHHHLMRSDGPEQNYVQVQRSFEDLKEKVLWLQENDATARTIASNNVKTFRERYLTSAAETCYWRKLIHGWASVSAEPRFWKDVNGTQTWRGLPVESFLLERRLEWDPY